jgi:biopolymer transport protein ExbB
MFTPEYILELLAMGWLYTGPLAFGSVVTLAIFVERWWRYRGLETEARSLSTEVVDLLARRDLDGARRACQKSKGPLGEIFLDALRWKNVALEDLERVLATGRAEFVTSLKRGLWIIGTVGSLAPFVGLFGTVIGIIRAFSDMAEHGAGGFAVVAQGISEALVATALGLFVAIVALAFYNYLNTRVGNVAAYYGRACERLVQALLFVETSAAAAAPSASGREVPGGSYATA